MEPLDLRVRPHLCIVCKRRFWTTEELQEHLVFFHEIGPHPMIVATIRKPCLSGNPSVPFNPRSNQVSLNSSVSLHQGSSQVPRYAASLGPPHNIVATIQNPYSSANQNIQFIPGSNSSVSLHQGSSQVPDDAASIDLQPKIAANIGNPYSSANQGVQFNQGSITSVSLHQGSSQVPDDTASIHPQPKIATTIGNPYSSANQSFQFSPGSSYVLQNSSVALLQGSSMWVKDQGSSPDCATAIQKRGCSDESEANLDTKRCRR